MWRNGTWNGESRRHTAVIQRKPQIPVVNVPALWKTLGDKVYAVLENFD